MGKYFFGLLLFTKIFFSQYINLSIKNSVGEPINYTNILIIDNLNGATKEFYSIKNGFGKITLKNSYTSLKLTINSTGFESKDILIENYEANKNYNFDIILQKKEIKINDIEEVIVKTDKKYEVKKDTVVYDIEKYKDGTERKIEDVLKKLPGIEVDGNGAIKYKGKAIETVTLDGDNIFDQNYRLGTKNINIDILDKVEAIDNYSKNTLLKGIESEGKVSLNLKLKKGKSDYSGSLESGFGLNNNLNSNYYSNNYLMQISRSVKSFATINLNNIGRSDSYFFDENKKESLDKLNEDNFKTARILNEDLFRVNLTPVKYNLNNQFFVSYNSLFKLSKKVNLKTNFNFIDDKISNNQNQTNSININNSQFTTTDNNTFTKKPKIYAGELEFSYYINKNSLLEIFTKGVFENNKFFTDYLKNNTERSNNIVATKNDFSLNKLIYTLKVNGKNALQANVYYTYNYIPQSFTSSENRLTFFQTSNFKRTDFLANVNLVGKKENLNYTFQVGVNNQKTNYFSDNGINSNNNIFYSTSINSTNNLKYIWNKFLFSTNLNLTQYNLTLKNLEENNSLSNNTLAFEPRFSIRYKVSTKSILTSGFTYNQSPISERNIFSKNVFTNNRISLANNPTLDFQKSYGYNFGYYYNSMLTETTFGLNSSYTMNNGLFLSNFTIDNNSTIIKNEFFKEENKIFSLNANYSTLFESIMLRIKLNSNFLNTEVPNFVNSNNIRKVSNRTYSNSLTLSTVFFSKFYLSNDFNHRYSESVTNIKFINSSIQNTFSLNFKALKNFRIVIKNELFFPNLKKDSNNYKFLDLEFYYTLNKKLNITFVGSNLLNENVFGQFDVNDFSSSSSLTNLLSRYGMFILEYNF